MSTNIYPLPGERIYQNQGQPFTLSPTSRNPPNLQNLYMDPDYEFLVNRYGPDVAYSLITDEINRGNYGFREKKELYERLNFLYRNTSKIAYVPPEWR